ncbi:MAG: benzoate-CoA ligase family protein [Zoogloeaceae bacterium]|jgi:benzoate-CoA ligase|nr:benzoate-CoA ligase family protein [Zoogloeaceae bacterium]
MPQLSMADHGFSPPRVHVPRDYNAAYDLIHRNLQAGRGGKTAFIDDYGSYTYDELAERVNRFSNALADLGIAQESRVMLCLLDTVNFPTAFLGSIQAGVVPIAANTLLTPSDYDYMLGDSRACALVVSETLWPQFAEIVGKHKNLKHVIISGKDGKGRLLLSDLVDKASTQFTPAPTTCDDMCFWLYSSGSTGAPKGTVHLHSHLIQTAELYARPVLGIREDDLVFSAAKLFFAYGLGNGMTFPMAVGATAILMSERPTPQAVFKRLREQKPTIFYGVPTLYAGLLVSPELPRPGDLRLRVCTSAGEALPADIGKRWTEHFGIEILDGIGSTEMLHIFLSNRPGEVRYGTTGKAVPGYELRVIGEDGKPVADGEPGELQISGPSAAAMYWNQREKSRHTFMGDWTRSGDKYIRDADGYFHYCGRSDDMLKVSGIYVSPFEVEAALMTHEAVLEAAVVAHADIDELIKPKAFVVLKPGVTASGALADALKQHVKDKLAPYKYPRWLDFVAELPKTATGKIQRFKLRA